VGFDLGLSQDQEMIRDSVRTFAEEVIRPRAAALDRSREFPIDN
jgi:isovaleryl-CoA dehydrogenase